jgi:hypothetical protein
MSSPTIQTSKIIKKNKKIDKSKIKPRSIRRKCSYSPDHKEEMEDGATAAVFTLLKEEKKMKRKTGKDFLHPPQTNTAEEIFNLFMIPYIVAVLVFALTQSGKTGLMIAIIKLWAEKCKNGDTHIEMENIYIITGLSSKDWKEQTLERMPGFLKENIFHRGGLNRKKNSFWKAIKGKKNCLILIDEVQIASTGKTIKKAFEKCGILDKNYCFKHDIKIVEVTATPDGIGIDLAKDVSEGGWPKRNYRYLSMPADEGHTSHFTYLATLDPGKQTRLYQYRDLVNYKMKNGRGTYDDAKSEQNIREIKQTYHTHFDNQPKYILIRVNTQHGAKTEENLKKVFLESECNYLEYNAKIKKRDWPQWNGPDDEADFKVDINKDLLDIEPKKLTIVLVKDMLRAAKTLTKHHIGIVYERAAKRDNDSAQIQGLPGRVTGYNVPDHIVVFTNIKTIRNYKKIYEADGNIAEANVPWNSTSSKTNSKGEVAAKGKTWHAAMSKRKRKRPEKEWIYRQAYFKLDDINNYSNDTCKLVYETEKDKDGNKIKPAEQQTPNIMENAGKTLTEYFAENGVFHNKVGLVKPGPTWKESHWQNKKKDGEFYSASIGGETGKQSTEFVDEKFKWQLNDTHFSQYHPTYEDVEDKNKLLWCLFYRYAKK